MFTPSKRVKRIEMFKIDQVKNLFDCDVCLELLVDPVSISCGSNVCKKNLDKLIDSFSFHIHTYKCLVCKEEHFLPKMGFQ